MNAMSRITGKKLDYYGRQRTDYARFLRDTEHHRMTVRQDDGVYRHITMANPKSSAYHFNITTFPGYLVYTGDMGSFVFSRLRDMFEFHRIDWDCKTPNIDYDYWAQKCEAKDKYSGTEEFDENAFREAAVRAFREHQWPDGEVRMEQWREEFRPYLLEAGHSSPEEAIRAMVEFSYQRLEFSHISGCYQHRTCRPFDDFYEHGSFTKPSLRLRWACWAIAYTIRCYDLGGDRFARQAAHDKLVLAGEV